MELQPQLPQAAELRIDRSKVQDYLLNLSHKEGGSKARYFLNCGFKRDDWQVMAEALRQHGVTQPVTETSGSRHGKKFTVECQIMTPDGRNPCILTAWIQEGEQPPRLVTAHPNR